MNKCQWVYLKKKSTDGNSLGILNDYGNLSYIIDQLQCSEVVLILNLFSLGNNT